MLPLVTNTLVTISVECTNTVIVLPIKKISSTNVMRTTAEYIHTPLKAPRNPETDIILLLIYTALPTTAVRLLSRIIYYINIHRQSQLPTEASACNRCLLL
jgi:hypothetical protein